MNMDSEKTAQASFIDKEESSEVTAAEVDVLGARKLAWPVRRAITLTRQWLLGQQNRDGHWVAELEGDTILESEYILLLAYLGRENSEEAQQAANYLLEKQMPEGGWQMYPGGPIEISGSVKAYFALKLTGHSPGAEYMQRARQAILAHGGADAVNSYTRFYLALLGQISYEQCPAVPPEFMLAPKWFPINLYAVSSWSRTIIVPLSIMWAYRPVRHIDVKQGVRELFLKEPDEWPPLRCPNLPGGTGLFSWDRLFRTIDRCFRWAHRHRITPKRTHAIKLAKEWMLKRFEGSDGLGAIFPPIVWSLVALKCLGYADDSPEVTQCYEELDALKIKDPKTGSLRLQPCKSPVWDTAITLRSLTAAGVCPTRPEIQRGIDWLLQKQIRKPGDWSETVNAEPGGWAFEYNNDFYPDSDDTAMALSALQSQFEGSAPQAEALPPDFRLIDRLSSHAKDEDQVRRMDESAQAIDRGLAWMLAMQNSDGGWGAFDRDNNRSFLCYVPFADHNAMIDPSTPDLTGHVLDSLGELGLRVGDPRVDGAVNFLRQSQEPNGSWFGRWGVNYIYGTGEALGGLASVGVSKDDPAMVAGSQWLLACQQENGGWGESADSYEAGGRPGVGPATASQTAWAVSGLIAAGLEHHPAVIRGIQFLIDQQNEDGTWDEPEVTGTGFPCVFYLKYHYYRIYFPLLAMARWAVKTAETMPEVPAWKPRIVSSDAESEEKTSAV